MTKDYQRLRECPYCGCKSNGQTSASLTETARIGPRFGVRCYLCGARIDFFETIDDAIAAWNSRAEDAEAAEMAQRIQSLELECAKLQDELRKAGNRGRLTAEQVRECVERVYLEGYSDGSVNRGAHIDETDWQAIADELNAALGGGECELVYGENDDGVDGWYTHCGGWFAATRKDRRLVHPGFCQLCGGKAVEQ